MNKKVLDCREVAESVRDFMVSHFGVEAESPSAIEGMWLAMQMVGGPQQAAQVVSYCALKVA